MRLSRFGILKAMNGGPSINVSKSCQVFLNAVDDGSWHMVHGSSGILLVNKCSLAYDWVRTKPGVVLSNNEYGIFGIEYE